ncbi:tetratricopeptide repeat protein [Megalodesulfovibrio paquesii]
MARKNNPKPSASPQSAPVAPMRVLALGGMGLFIIAIFLGSFLSRMSQDTRFEDRRPQSGMGGMGSMGQTGQMPPGQMPSGEAMPPAMAEAMKKAQESGQAMPQQTPQGMPGQAMAGLDPQAIGRVGALMRQMQTEPNNATLLAMLADEFMHVNDWDASISFLNRALVIEPSNARVMGLLGISHFNSKQYETAAQYFETLLTVEPDNAGAHYNLGMIYTRFLNKPEEGRRKLEALLKLPTASDQLRQEAQQLLHTPPAPSESGSPAAGAGNASSS